MKFRPWKELTDQILEKSPDIILLGETNHYSPAFPEFYDQFIRYVSKHSEKKYDCFLGEKDSRYSAAFDRFFEGASYEDSVTSQHKELKADIEIMDSRIKQRFSVTKKVAKTLKKLRIRFYGFDVIFDSVKGRKYNEIVMAYKKFPDDKEIQRKLVELLYIERHQIMVKNILQIMKDNCSSAIGYIGSDHIMPNIKRYYPGYKGEPVIPIHSQLQSAGLYTFTIYLEEKRRRKLDKNKTRFDPTGFGHFKDVYKLGLDAQIYIPRSQTH